MPFSQQLERWANRIQHYPIISQSVMLFPIWNGATRGDLTTVLSPTTMQPSESSSVPFKRRRISNDENVSFQYRSGDLSSMKIIRTFESDYRASVVAKCHGSNNDSAYDSDDDVDFRIRRHSVELQQRTLKMVMMANKQQNQMEGTDEVLLTIPRATLYKMEAQYDCRSGEQLAPKWNKGGKGTVKFLRDLDEDEFTYGMVWMVMKDEQTLMEKFRHIVDPELPATCMKASKESICLRPTYIWRALEGAHISTYALRFPTAEDALHWKSTFEESRIITRTARNKQCGADLSGATAGVDATQQLKDQSLSGAHGPLGKTAQSAPGIQSVSSS